MGSKGEKKSGLVGEKSHSVYSANWKLDAMLEKELSMLDTSKHRVEHRIAMDQVVAQKRFQVKLHHSKVFHARMKGDREMLKKLITKDNYDFNTNTTSVDVLNKRREKDLAKKRVLHRQSQAKMMTFRNATPTPVPSSKIPDLQDAEEQRSATEEKSSKTIRPMTAIERITHAKLLATGQSDKIRPKTAGVDRPRTKGIFPSITKRITPLSTSELADKMRSIPENNFIRVRKDEVDETEKGVPQDKPKSQEIVIEITTAVEDDIRKEESRFKDENNNIKQSSESAQATQNEESLSGDCSVNANESKGTLPKQNIGVPRKFNLRPKTAIGTTSSTSETLTSSSKQSRPRTSLTVTDHYPSDQSDNESTTSHRLGPSQTGGGHRKSVGKSKRKKSAVSIFSNEKVLTIMDIDKARHDRAKQRSRIEEYVKSLDGVKTDPDQIVDYYMARLLEESSLSGTQKNVERIRDMPDSDYDVDLARRSLGNLKANTITFRDVNRKYGDYVHDPYTPLHPTSMAYGLASRTSTTGGGGLAKHESHMSLASSAWQGTNDSFSDSD